MLCGRDKPVAALGGGQRPDLAQKSKLIPTVPTFDNLTVHDPNQNDAGDVDPAAGCGHAQIVALGQAQRARLSTASTALKKPAQPRWTWAPLGGGLAPGT